MKILWASSKTMVPVLVLLFALPFAYDLYRFIENLDILLANYIAESLTVLFGILYYFHLQNTVNLRDKSIQENLKLFVYLLGVLYLVVIIAQLVFTPSYSIADSPPLPETLSSVISANLMTAASILLITPILIVFKNLIYYKRTRRNFLFMRGLIIFSAAAIISVIVTQAPFNFEFAGPNLYGNILFSIVLALIVIQSFRNSWITYLSRKEKLTYFLISIFIFWAVFYLYDFAFKYAIPSHSLAAGAFVFIAWIFQVAYVLICSIYLLFHLPTARVFDRKMNEVASLHDLSRELSSEFDFNKLVKLLTEMALKVIGADSTWMELYQSDSKELYIASAKNLSQDEISDFGKSGRQILSEKVFSTRKPILLNEIGKNHPYAYIRDWKQDIGSIIGAPLISSSGKPLGFLFATKKRVFGFYPDDLAMLEAFANQGVIALDNATLLKESFERERMEEELRIAREVQQRLLPNKTPEYNGVSIEALTITAYEVGGDYYDFIKFPDNRLGFIIGDVSGKGTSAAFYMAEAKGIIQSLGKSFHQPRELLIRTNEILYETLERKTFISMLMASLDCESHTFSFARAGHCPLLYFNSKKNTARLLQPKGIGVGLEKGDIFQKTLVEEKISCNEGDIFVFYTDGLSEARNHMGEEYGDDRLVELISTNTNMTARELKEIIIDSILSFLDGQGLTDDLTLLLVKL
jgi:serine phosphatase RsbU (regulator of sigma subunit)